MSSNRDCGCQGKTEPNPEAPQREVAPSNVVATAPNERSQLEGASELANRMAMWRAYAENPNHNPCAARTAGKRWKAEGNDKICDVGDMVLFNSLLCYSGDVSACDAVRRSQDNTGRWWRSPMHVDANGNPTNYPGSKYSFSKDHTLGVLLYFVTTPDRETARAQARAWLRYMQKQGRVWDKLRIGPDIPEPIGYKAAKSLMKCTDGLMADGCAVRETITTVKEVWEKVRDCVLHPGDCWAKVRKEVQEEVDREIGYWTHNVCPEASLSTCTVSPGLWFLFHRVWRDSLGLAPSASMRFADSLFDDSSYDDFVSWEADQPDGNVHLAAVNGLVRALLGKPASGTIVKAYQKNPDNPFFQFLMHNYVNNNMHPTGKIRDYLLSIAPSKIEEYDNPGGYKWFRNEGGADNAGDQWAWERKDVRGSVRDTMGWDCIFLGNLLVREFQIELDYYKQNVLPDLLRDRKRVLNQALSRLAESYGAVQRIEARLDEFVEKAVAVITHPNVTFAELEQLNRDIVQRHQKTCPLSLKQLWDDYSVARAAYEALLRLKEESRRKFQDAERLAEFGEIWGPQMAHYANTENHLRDVQLRLDGKTACLKLGQLLAAIPLRMEEEAIKRTYQGLREVADQIAADLKQTAKDLEYDRIKTELNLRSAHLAESLRQNRFRHRYEDSTQLAAEIGDHFQSHYLRLASGATLLGADDLAEIRHDAVQIIEREKQEWEGFVAEFGGKQIVLGRLQVLNARAMRQFEQIQQYPQGHQRSLYFQWRLRAQEAGYRTTQDCRNAGSNAYRQLSCWQFEGPSDSAPHDDWVLFDLLLNGVEQLIADFATTGRPIDIERAELLERRQLPATGVLFDVQAEGACRERIQTPRGIRFRGCKIPQWMAFQAAPVSPSGGNAVIEGLAYYNRLVILVNGESFSMAPSPASVTYKLNGRRYGDQALQVGGKVDVDLPVPYSGAVLELEVTELNESNVLKPGTRIEVQVNYAYPDVRALKVYASMLGKFTKFLARVYRDLAPGSAQTEVIASLDEGVELLGMLLDRDDLDAITHHQIETARSRMTDGKSSITQACSKGGPELCTAQIRTVRESLTTNIENATRELTSLRQFLQAEIQRLTGINDDIRQRLKAILDGLAHPERIIGIQTFLVFLSKNDELSELAADGETRDEETLFVRGEEVTLTIFDDAFFHQHLTRNEPDRKTVGDFFAAGGSWEWNTVGQTRRCGTAEYAGIRGDLGGRGRPSGPVFNSGACSNQNLRYINVIFMRCICPYSRVIELHRRRGMAVLRIQAVLEYSARPVNRRQWQREQHDGKVIYQSFRCNGGTEQEFSSSYEHLEGDTTGVVDPDVSFEAYF